MKLHTYSHSPFLNETTLINFENLGTPKQEAVIARIIQNWDDKRYLKPAEKHFLGCSQIYCYRNTSHNLKM